MKKRPFYSCQIKSGFGNRNPGPQNAPRKNLCDKRDGFVLSTPPTGFSGTLSLLPNPSAPNSAQHNFDGGYFIYDDQLYPGQNPLLTVLPAGQYDSLLFTVTGAPDIAMMSIGATGSNTYDAWLVYQSGSYWQEVGDFTLTQAVPEPGVVTLLVTMLAAMAGGVGVLKKLS